MHRCFDLLLASSLHIAGEVVLPISLYLIGPSGATLESVRTVESHPVALGQCETFLSENHHLTRVEADDTAGSVHRAVASGDPTRAAIGSIRAAELYGGNILREHVEDHTENYTRFVLLAENGDLSRSGTKLSLLVTLKHRAGALHSGSDLSFVAASICSRSKAGRSRATRRNSVFILISRCRQARASLRARSMRSAGCLIGSEIWAGIPF